MKRLIKGLEPHGGDIISCDEGKGNARFDCDGARFYKIKLDSKPYEKYTNGNKKCDFVIASQDAKTIAVYIEMKSGDLKTAFEQIKTSKTMFGAGIEKSYGAIIHNGKPKGGVSSPNLKVKAKKENFERLFIHEKKIQLRYVSSEREVRE